MHYLGGKSRTATRIAETIAGAGYTSVREPFVGGASVTVALRRLGVEVDASDVDCALVTLYAAVYNGWRPPAEVSASDYAFARTLPESDPMHGFCAFAMSYGGKRWGGYSAANPAARTARTLERQKPYLFDIRQVDVFDEPPLPDDVFYADPPYGDTTGYGSVWSRLRWADWLRRAACCDVFLSEYTLAPGFAEVWSVQRQVQLRDGRPRPRRELLQFRKGCRNEI